MLLTEFERNRLKTIGGVAFSKKNLFGLATSPLFGESPRKGKIFSKDHIRNIFTKFEGNRLKIVGVAFFKILFGLATSPLIGE